MDTSTPSNIEVHAITCGQGNQGQILIKKNTEKVTDSGVMNSSNVDTVVITTQSGHPGILHHTSNQPSNNGDIQHIKQHHAYSTLSKNSNGYDINSICSETICDSETFLAAMSPAHSKTNCNSEMSHDTTLMRGLDSGQSHGNQTKSPVIMFKWGSMKKPFRCQICDMSFTDGNLLRSHLEKHKSSKNELLKPYPCNLCTKSFQSNRSLERHQITHSGQTQKKCKLCYKVFANKENLEKHLLMHSTGNANKAQPCPSCNEQFTSRKLLEKHIGTHWQIRSYHCQVCDKSFTRKDGLDRHLYTHDLGKRDKHQCVECAKSFSFLFALKRHVRSVHGGEPDGKKCEVCGKFIKNKENIARHMLLHQGLKPYECTTCQRKFSQKQHLIDHMVIHTNTLPFQCKICSYSFRYRRTLSRHIRKHYKVDKEKQIYECLDCHTTYTSEKDLVEHASKSHYDFISCVICDQTFGDERTYRKHMLKDHKVSSGYIDKNLVNKSTETETDLSFLEYTTETEGVEYCEVTELTRNDASNVICTVSNTEHGEVAVENDFQYSGESIENLTEEGNISYTIKGEEEDGQKVVYILYDDGKVQEMEEGNEVIQDGVEISEFIQEQHHIDKDSIVGNQIVQICELGTQPTSSYELDHVKESRQEDDVTDIGQIISETTEEVVDNQCNTVVEISHGTNDEFETEQPMVEVVEDGQCLYLTTGETLNTGEEDSSENRGQNTEEDSSGTQVQYTYNVVVPQQVKEDGTTGENRVEESNYSAERFKLLQSLIDYAEKIQEEEEQSMSNIEKPANSETQI